MTQEIRSLRLPFFHGVGMVAYWKCFQDDAHPPFVGLRVIIDGPGQAARARAILADPRVAAGMRYGAWELA
jgi:hypothetical protein